MPPAPLLPRPRRRPPLHGEPVPPVRRLRQPAWVRRISAGHQDGGPRSCCPRRTLPVSSLVVPGSRPGYGAFLPATKTVAQGAAARVGHSRYRAWSGASRRRRVTGRAMSTLLAYLGVNQGRESSSCCWSPGASRRRRVTGRAMSTLLAYLGVNQGRESSSCCFAALAAGPPFRRRRHRRCMFSPPFAASPSVPAGSATRRPGRRPAVPPPPPSPMHVFPALRRQPQRSRRLVGPQGHGATRPGGRLRPRPAPTIPALKRSGPALGPGGAPGPRRYPPGRAASSAPRANDPRAQKVGPRAASRVAPHG